MRLRITADQQNFPSILEKLNAWNADIVTKDESGNQLSIVSSADASGCCPSSLFLFCVCARACAQSGWGLGRGQGQDDPSSGPGIPYFSCWDWNIHTSLWAMNQITTLSWLWLACFCQLVAFFRLTL